MSNKRKVKKKKNQKQEQIFRPISWLPKVAEIIDGSYYDLQEQYKLFTEAVQKPHVMDDKTIDRAIRVYEQQMDDDIAIKAQLDRWKDDPKITVEQKEEVERLLRGHKKVNNYAKRILEIAKEIKKGTIDRIMEMSDEELGMDFMTGKRKFDDGLKKSALTLFTDEQIEIVEKIDSFVKGIESRGGGDEELLVNMLPYMADFRKIMDETNEAMLNTLALCYSGFGRYSELLSNLAGAIQSGEIEVP